MCEIWKVITDYPDYAVSDQGRVKRIVDCRVYKAGKILTPHASDRGYMVVGLVKEGKRHPITVHRLVMDIFVGPRPDGFDRSHLDGNPRNNKLSNLVFEPKDVNNLRKNDHGTRQSGEKNGNSKLSKQQVSEIMKLLSEKNSRRKIAKMFGVHNATICNIANAKTWVDANV